MKKATIFAGALLAAALTSGQLYAQEGKTDLAANDPAKAISAVPTLSGESFSKEAAVSKTTARAAKDFKSRFTNVADEQWSHTRTGFCAYFTSDGFKTRAYYDSRGHWQASLKYCDESKLPFAIRDVVKRNYYDLAITLVNIIEVPEHVAYVVHLEDKKTLKIVRVSEDGDIETMNDFVKSN